VRVWDFENKCWKKPEDSKDHAKKEVKDNTITMIDPALLTDPKFKIQG
jgi:hypothetical protein